MLEANMNNSFLARRTLQHRSRLRKKTTHLETLSVTWSWRSMISQCWSTFTYKESRWSIATARTSNSAVTPFLTLRKLFCICVFRHGVSPVTLSSSGEGKLANKIS